MGLSELRRSFATGTLPDAVWREITVAGVRCEALVAGSGPPVVLMHGGLDSCMQWVPILPRLAARYRCYLPERPSNGASDPFDYGRLRGDFRRHAADVTTDMFDGLGIERAAVVGNSMGGLFSIAFATAQPTRVSRLVLVGVPAGQEDAGLPGPVRLMAHPVAGSLIAWLSRRAGPRDSRRVLRQLLMADADRCPDALLEIMTATTRRNARAWRDFAVRVAVDGEVRPDLASGAWLADLAMPVSYIVGERDVFGSPEGIRVLADRIGADVTVIEDAGHLPWLDDPDATTDAILRSLAGRRRGPEEPVQHGAA